LLARIEEASRLPTPHQFDQSKQFGDVRVFGLADAVQALRTLGNPFLNWAGQSRAAVIRRAHSAAVRA
jgi:hypothetical protein